MVDVSGYPYAEAMRRMADAVINGTYTPGTLITALAADVAAIRVDLETPASSIPHFAADTTNDLSYVHSSSAASGEVTLVSATSSQTTRGYRMVVAVSAATTIEFRDGASGTALFTLYCPAAGAYFIGFDSRPWFKTTANTALIRNSSAAVTVDINLWYLKN